MKRQTMLFLGAALWAALAAAPSDAQGLGGLAGKVRTKSESKKNDQQQTVGVSAPLPPYTGPKKRLGVMDLEMKVKTTSATDSGGTASTTTVYLPPPVDFSEGMTQMLTTALVNSNRFIVLERAAIEDIKKEHAFGTEGLADPTSAAKSGSLLGAQALVRGAVTEFTHKRSSFSGSGAFGKALGVSTVKVEAMLAVDIRLYDTMTGQILDSVRAEGRAASSGTSVDLSKGDLKVIGAGFSSSPLGHATRQAIERAVRFICEKMEARPWEGRVAEIEAENGGAGTAIYINAGSDTGLKVGDELEILRPGREIVDPQTRLVLGRTKDTHVGRCKVESVTEKIAVARPVEGEGFQKEDLVRFKTSP